MFGDCLRFEYNGGDEIEELDLRPAQPRFVQEAPPRVLRDDHLFILGWNEPRQGGKHLLKKFKTQDNYDCAIYFSQAVGKKSYIVEVTYKGNSDYLKLSDQLPVELKYMAYYCWQALGIKLDDKK